jgi:2'-5' RNA ligase
MCAAVIVPIELPPPLEAFRQGHVPDARLGVPAHVTLLYPYVPADELTDTHHDRLASAVRRFTPFTFELTTIERWPDTLYVAPLPAQPFADLAAALAADWPEWPLYGGGVAFEPHVTLGQPADDASASGLREAAAGCLPASREATHLLVIAEAADGRWTERWRLPLGG